MYLHLYKRIFGLSDREVTFSRRQFFVGDRCAQQQLEQIGRTFLQGYHAALDCRNIDDLGIVLDQHCSEFRGFAFEGAAMGLALLDGITPWQRQRLSLFLNGPGLAHTYMVHVGVGWAMARLHQHIGRTMQSLDPLLSWLAVDGYGFHQGYFYWQQHLRDKYIPPKLSGYAQQVFDQGLGRSLWFVKGADVQEIALVIAGFVPERQANLWSGIGLASTYAGGVDRSSLEALRSLAHQYQPQLSQGVAFAAKTRQRAGNLTPYTTLACQILCGTSVAEVAEVTDRALVDLPSDGLQPTYQVWRERIQTYFSLQKVGV